MRRFGQVVEFPTGVAEKVKTQLQLGNFEAHLFVNAKADPPVHHYIISRQGDAEILFWGQERSQAAAEKAALGCLEDYNRRYPVQRESASA